MTYDEQLRIAALVDKLINQEAETFETADVLELSAMLPVHEYIKYEITASFFSNFNFLKGFFSGLTNTGHKVALDDDKNKPVQLTNKHKSEWVGKYRLLQERSKDTFIIEISDRFMYSRIDTPNYYSFVVKNGEVPKMYKYSWKTYKALFVTLSISKKQLYKLGTAAVEQRRADNK